MKKIIRILLSILFGGVVYSIFQKVDYTYGITSVVMLSPNAAKLVIFLLMWVFAAIIFYILFSKPLTNLIFTQVNKCEETLSMMSLKDLLVSVGSILVGLITANLLGIAVLQYRYIGTVIVIFLNIILGYLGYRIAQRKKEDINILELCATSDQSFAKPKILDTSVIIDGRILDILRTGLIEGTIVVPNFILAELRHIADSSDSLKRNRGRRGLDILNEMQKQLKIPVQIVELDYKDIDEVDSKLLKVAEEMNAVVVTNDFNLNKVADFQGVEVFNINELANAIKPVVLPGEEMIVTVIKDGKEDDQGIGYLNDGTMIVVEGGRRSMGRTIEVLVTSVLQTAAGRMIFTKMKDQVS
ncbi:MAG: TRAM domain-containing protein [Epulopiscium sp.]|nr:TRAM domain-containing protein [Candidatus Epulonipiscium sp.]